MAKTNKGSILGGFTGKIGDVVGYYHRGEHCIRKAPGKTKRSPTTAQKELREKFGMMTKFMSPLFPLIKEIHQKSSKYSKAYYKLYSSNYHDALPGSFPLTRIDYSKISLSRGFLPPPEDAIVACASNGKLIFAWVHNDHGWNKSSYNDKVYMAIYCVENKTWTSDAHVADRSDEKYVIPVTAWSGKTVHAYIGCYASQSSAVANSVYLGTVSVP